MKYTSLICCAVIVTILLCACNSYIYLEETPENCYAGTDIYTLDHICEQASVWSTSEDVSNYNAKAVYRVWASYTNYLSERKDIECLEISSFEFYAVYDTPYGEITVEVVDHSGRRIDLRGTGALNLDDYGYLKVEISR